MQNTFYRNNFDYILIHEMDQEEMLFVAVLIIKKKRRRKFYAKKENIDLVEKHIPR